MSFPTAELLKPNYSPVIIAQLDKSRLHDFSTNYAPFVWGFNIDAIYPLIEPALLVGVTTYDYQTIGGVVFNDIIGTRVGNLAEVKLIAGSWYQSGKTVYYHCPDNKRPTLFNISLGVAVGFRRGGSTAYYNDIYHDDRIVSIPNISKSENDLYTGKSAFEGGTIELNNEDGELDAVFEDEEYEGNGVRLYLGFDGYTFPDDFRKVHSGYIESIIRGADRVSISSKDERKRFKLSLPNRPIDPAIWPNVSENNYNTPLPLLYGQANKIPVKCLNEQETPTPANYRFLICDTTYHNISSTNIKPYIEKVAVTARAVQYDTANDIAYFEIPSAASEYTTGNDIYIVGWTGAAEEKVKGYTDAGGNIIEQALEIIKDLIINYYGVIFTGTFFNLSHWDDASDYVVSLFLDSSTDFSAVVDMITSSSRVNFIIEDDGRYAARIFNPDSAILQYIYKEDILQKTDIESDTTRIIAVTKIGYNKDYSENKYSYYIDDSNLQTLRTDYQAEELKTFDTLLISESVAIELSDYILNDFAKPDKVIEIQTNLLTVTREIGDTIQIEIARPVSTNTRAYFKSKIIGISKDLNNGLISLTCRLISKIDKTAFTTGEVWNGCRWGSCRWSKNYYRTNLKAV